MTEDRADINPDKPSVVQGFVRKPAEWWRDWLLAFLDHREPQPNIPVVDHGYYQALAGLFDDLAHAGDRESFTEGLSQALEFTPIHSHNCERFYYLIDLVAYVKPSRGRRLLRNLLDSRLFLTLEYAEMPLHWSALSAMGKYEVDQNTIECVLRLADQSTDFSFLLVCARVLSHTLNPRLGYGFLARIVALLSPENVSLLRREMRPIIRRLTRKGLLVWYQTDVLGANGRQLGLKYPVQTELLRSVLARVVPWKSIRDPIDAYEALAAAQFADRGQWISPADVKALAQLTVQETGRDETGGVEREHIVAVLTSLYRLDAWDIMDKQDLIFGKFAEPDTCVVYSREGESVILRFSQNRPAIGILKEAKLRAEGGQPEIEDFRDPRDWASKRLVALPDKWGDGSPISSSGPN